MAKVDAFIFIITVTKRKHPDPRFTNQRITNLLMPLPWLQKEKNRIGTTVVYIVFIIDDKHQTPYSFGDKFTLSGIPIKCLIYYHLKCLIKVAYV